MKRQTVTVCGLAASLLFGLPLVAISEEQAGTTVPPVAQAKDSQPQPKQAIKYQPPHKGAPATTTRRGGGTRGLNKSVPVISLLAPEHVGWTLLEQPVLYWFTPTKQDKAFSFEFTLIGDNAEAPVVDAKLPPPAQAGLQQIKLADYNVKLSPGERYQWSVSLIVDAEERSANVVAKGAIERIDREKLQPPMTTVITDAEAPARYAEAGIWYDTVMALTDRIQSNPANNEWRQQRASLLEQVGLADVASNALMAQSN
ncbi:MAG: hypothetical protein NTNFB02_26870 [Nitrospira sp.]